MTDTPSTAREMPKHVEVSYTDAIRNLIFLKQHQVTITNYAIVAYAAVVAMIADKTHLNLTSTAAGTTILVVITFFGFGFSVWFLASLDAAIAKNRLRLEAIYRTYFTNEERALLGLHDATSKPQGITLGLGAISALGFAVAVYAMGKV